MIYIILGMHKSGTTLFSNILHSSNINMIEKDRDNFEYDNNTIKGERLSTIQINFKIMNTNPEILSIYRKKIKTINKNVIDEAKKTIKDLNYIYHDWGFKDPQTCITYNKFWKNILPEHKLICVFRNPYEIWNRYEIKEHNIKKHPFKYLFKPILNLYRAWYFIDAWYKYNKNIIIALKHTNKSNYFLCEYKSFLEDDITFNKFGKFLGLKLIDKRNKDMYRNKKERKYVILDIMEPLYRKITKNNIFHLYKELQIKAENFIS